MRYGCAPWQLVSAWEVADTTSFAEQTFTVAVTLAPESAILSVDTNMSKTVTEVPRLMPWNL